MTANPTTTEQIVLSTDAAASLREVLGICEEFLRTAGPAVDAELRAHLARQCPPTEVAWLIDMLGFTSLHLTRELTAQDRPHPAQSEDVR